MNQFYVPQYYAKKQVKLKVCEDLMARKRFSLFILSLRWLAEITGNISSVVVVAVVVIVVVELLP